MNRLEYLGVIARLEALENHAGIIAEALTVLTQLVEELKASKQTNRKGGSDA